MLSISLMMSWLAGSATIAVMFSGALTVGLTPLKRLREQPRLFLRTLFVIWLVVPTFTILVVLTFGVTGLSAGTLLLMSVCPGIPYLLSSATSVRGSASTAFLVLFLTAASEPLLIPAWTRVLTTIHPMNLTVSPRNVSDVLIPTVFLPIAVGFAVRALFPRRIPLLARICAVVFSIGFAGSMIMMLARGGPLLLQVPPRTYVAAFVIFLGDAVIGYWAGAPRIEDRRAIALAAAMGNPALALAVVEASYPELLASSLVAVYLLLRTVMLAPFEWWLKHRPDAPSAEPVPA